MENKHLTKSISTSGKYNVEQTSGSTKSARALRRADIKVVQNVRLVWLDNNIDEKKEDCRHTVAQLRRFVNDANTFTDTEECIQFIDDINDNKVCMIISESLGQHIVPRVHSMSQVDSIFIFCGNRKYDEQWTKEWSKIKGVFMEVVPICEALKQASQQCEQNAISISFVDTEGHVSNKNLDRLDPMFMYTQIMKEILLTIEFEPQHFQEFIGYCRNIFEDNKETLVNVNKFEQKYHDKTPIWWYTCEPFLYPMLNRALRMSNVDIIIKMGFFIDDLHRHIDELHKKQFGAHQNGNIFKVYRGQGLSKANVEQMIETKGGLISFNNFLSTSKDRAVSLAFAESNASHPDLFGILFVMTIDPSRSATPFASINGVSHYGDEEDEVLFSMHTVFRINDIQSMGANQRLVQVDLTLTGENDDKDLRKLTDHIRVETYPNSEGWYRLAMVLLKLGRPEKAEQVYQVLLEQATDETKKGDIYRLLGIAKNDQAEYKEAITFYEKSLEMYGKNLPPNDSRLATCDGSIGSAYSNMGEYSKALSYFEKALEISQKSLPPNHPHLASSYSNIGTVYVRMGEFSKAFSYYEKTLEI